MAEQRGPEPFEISRDSRQPPGYGGYQPPVWPPPPSPPPPPNRRRGRTAARVLLLLVTGAALGAGLTLATHRPQSTSTALSVPVRPGANPSLAPLPTAPPESSTGPALDPGTIASRVDPAIVDIIVTIAHQGQGEATGMILTPSGEVLTNNHVVAGATSISVQVNGSGPQHQATVIGVDPTDDVALIQMTGVSGLPTVPLGRSSSVSVGDQIVALGNALGRGGTPTVTPGVVTNLDQTITVSDPSSSSEETLVGMIQVQAAIQPGESGGPMVDASGHVVGMTTAGSVRARRSGRVGFGIPIDNAITIARQIQAGSGPNILPGHRGILGIQVDGRATAAGGALVVGVDSGSPAASAGLANGALITHLDGATIDSADMLTKELQHRKPGDVVTVRWFDLGGKEHNARVKLASGPPA